MMCSEEAKQRTWLGWMLQGVPAAADGNLQLQYETQN
jgi:hypothetical protein